MGNKIILHTETTIDSAHYLNGYNGKCKKLHGHTWLFELWIRGSLEDKDEVGILFDFGEVKKLREKLDHTILNNVLNVNPSAENLAEYIYNFFKNKNNHLEFVVKVYETAVRKETWAEFGDWEI